MTLPPATEACTLSEGKVFIAMECQPRKFVQRVQSVSLLFCDIIRRINVGRSSLYRYCDPPSSSHSSSSSSSSIDCPGPSPYPVPEFQFLVSPNDLGADEWDALAALESEACTTLRSLINFENSVKNPCEAPASSSFSSSSSESSESSSSSSGTLPSSSSSSLPSSSSSVIDDSSSSSAEPECQTSLHLASFCELIPNTELYPMPAPLGYSQCAYGGEPYVAPSSSSSSLSSSSSSGIDPSIRVLFNDGTLDWEVHHGSYGVVAIRTGGDLYDPTGAYTFTYGPCIGQSLFVV